MDVCFRNADLEKLYWWGLLIRTSQPTAINSFELFRGSDGIFAFLLILDSISHSIASVSLEHSFPNPNCASLRRWCFSKDSVFCYRISCLRTSHNVVRTDINHLNYRGLFPLELRERFPPSTEYRFSDEIVDYVILSVL